MNDYLIIVPLTEAVSWDWSADYIRQTVLALSKMNTRVIVYMDSDASFMFGNQKRHSPRIKNVTFYYPRYPFPLKRFRAVREINRAIDFELMLRKFAKNKKVVFWTFGPVSSSILNIVNRNTNAVSLYDCVDYYGSVDKKKDRDMHDKEDALIRNVDYFFVNSHALQDLHKKVRPGRLVVQGFASDVYQSKFDRDVSIPTDKPLVGFVGSIDLRTDFEVLLPVVEKLTDYRFALWGPIHEKEIESSPKKHAMFKRLMSLPNVINGLSPRSKVPGLIKKFDVGIIPYDLSMNFCKYCYPMKLFEYFYLGKPVISSGVKELTRFPDLIKIAKNSADWEKFIVQAIKKPLSGDLVKKQKHLALANSWKIKVKQILSGIGAINEN